MIDAFITVAVVIEGVTALVLTAFNVREVLFLRRLRPFLPPGDDLPLYDALVGRAIFLAASGLYLLTLTTITVLFAVNLAQAFPVLRVINGLLFLGLLSGPILLGRAMRRRPSITVPPQ